MLTGLKVWILVFVIVGAVIAIPYAWNEFMIWFESLGDDREDSDK